MNLTQLILGYLFMINIVGYVVCSADKRYAQTKRRRVPERTLFLLAVLGGSLGVYLAMQIKRHKTKHWYFAVGIPLIFILQVVGVWIVKQNF